MTIQDELMGEITGFHTAVKQVQAAEHATRRELAVRIDDTALAITALRSRIAAWLALDGLTHLPEQTIVAISDEIVRIDDGDPQRDEIIKVLLGTQSAAHQPLSRGGRHE